MLLIITSSFAIPLSHLKVNYSDNEQWNMWVKVGIRQLVLSDGKTTTMTKHESSIVRQHENISFPRQISGAWNKSLQVSSAATKEPFVLPCIQNRVHAPFSVSGAMEEDDSYDPEMGSDLLDELGWSSDLEVEVPPKAAVSC